MKRTIFSILTSGLLALSSSNVMADNGWFAGLGIGQSENNDYECIGCGAAIGSLDDSGTASKLFGGYRFNQYLAVQAGYVDLSDTDATGVGAAWTDKLEVDGFYGSIQGILPVNDKIDVFASIGVFSWDQTVTFSGATGSFDGNDEFYGIGASYSFANPGLKIQAEWNRFNNVGNTDPFFMHVDDYDLWTINAVYDF